MSFRSIQTTLYTLCAWSLSATFAAAGCSSASTGDGIAEEEDTRPTRRGPGITDAGSATDTLDDAAAADVDAEPGPSDATREVSDTFTRETSVNPDPDVIQDVTTDPPEDVTPDTADTASEDVTTVDTEPDVPPRTPLDPNLATPPESNPPCTTPGSRGECGFLEICRHFSAEESRCESCDDGTCNGLGQPCSRTAECDILFTCYLGRCTGTCDLTTPQVCGVPTDCIDVGHPTHGVCLPR